MIRLKHVTKCHMLAILSSLAVRKSLPHVLVVQTVSFLGCAFGRTFPRLPIRPRFGHFGAEMFPLWSYGLDETTGVGRIGLSVPEHQAN
jgi:hypothetical protein